MDMKRILTALSLLIVLAGCASVPPLSASDAERVKSGKTAVLFTDGVQQINYLQDKYYVLAVTQEGSTSVYKGIWNSGKDLSAIHADEFSKLGLKAKSAYEFFGEQDLERFIQQDRDAAAARPKGATDPTLSPQLRQALLDKNQDYLIRVTWSGYTLHIQTLGLPTNEQFLTLYRIFDVKNNKLLGGGDYMYLHSVDLEGQTGKDFLEKDNLAGFRSQVEKHIRARFAEPPHATIGKILGLKG
jgi:hypothetical protein